MELLDSKMITVSSLILISVLATETKCIRWTWSGDVYNRRVVCLEWSTPPTKKPRKGLFY